MTPSTKTNSTSFWQSPVKTILVSGFTAGTLDMTTAIFVYTVLMKKTTAIKILYSIASGVFGKRAYDGGWQFALYGLGLHYLIAFSFAIFYFSLFPYIAFLRKQKIIAGLLYGIFVWIIMNLVVLHLVFQKLPPFNWNSALIGASILMLCIGLPVSLITSKYYALKQHSSVKSELN